MKKNVILLSLVVLFTVSCEKNEHQETNIWTNETEKLCIHNESKTNITEGIWGTLVKTEGNCMPVVASCKTE